MVLKVSQITTFTPSLWSGELGEYCSCPGQQPSEGDSWSGLQSVPGTVVQAPSRNPQIRHAIFCRQIAVLAWWQPEIGSPWAPVQRLCGGSTAFVPAQLGGAAHGFLWHIYLLAVFYDTWKIGIKSCQKYPFNFSIFKLPVQQVLRKLTPARQRAELWVYLYAFNFTLWLEREKIVSWWVSLSKPILSYWNLAHWKEVRSFHPLQRASDQPITL